MYLTLKNCENYSIGNSPIPKVPNFSIFQLFMIALATKVTSNYLKFVKSFAQTLASRYNAETGAISPKIKKVLRKFMAVWHLFYGSRSSCLQQYLSEDFFYGVVEGKVSYKNILSVSRRSVVASQQNSRKNYHVLTRSSRRCRCTDW